MSSVVAFLAKRRQGPDHARQLKFKEMQDGLATSLSLSSVVPLKERSRRLRNVAVESNPATLHTNGMRCDVIGSCVSLLLLVHELSGVMEWLQHPSIIVLSFDRYVRFLQLHLEYEDEFIVPPLDVRYIWLIHTTNPLAYSCDLELALGRKFDHALLTEQDVQLHHQEDLRRTKALWQEKFHEPFDFEELTDDLALAFESYPEFCKASYAKLTASRPENRRREIWTKFGINQRHVLFNNQYFAESLPKVFAEDLPVICETIARCRQARHEAGTSDADANDELSMLQEIVLGEKMITYNKFIIHTAVSVEKGLASKTDAFVPVIISGSPNSHARLFCYAHMANPKQYRTDCRKLLGSLLYLSDDVLKAISVDIPDFDPSEHPDELPHVVLALSQSRSGKPAGDPMDLLAELEFHWVGSDSEEEAAAAEESCIEEDAEWPDVAPQRAYVSMADILG